MIVDGGRPRIVTAVMVRPANENDSHAVERLLDEHAMAVEQPARELVADSGYTSEPALKACEKRGLLPTLARRSTRNRHPVIGDSKVKHGLERACFRGREKVLIQALLTASVLNIKAADSPAAGAAGGGCGLTPASFASTRPALGSSAHLLRGRGCQSPPCRQESIAPPSGRKLPTFHAFGNTLAPRTRPQGFPDGVRACQAP